MTEKRYSDGTLAKWYYSQTNVICDGDNEYYLRNKESIKDWNYNELLGTNDLLDELNRLSDENKQLKQAYTRLKHRHSLLHDVCIDAECDRDSYRKDIASLEKENKQLKQKVNFYKFFQKDARELEKKNEQLKKRIMIFQDKIKGLMK